MKNNRPSTALERSHKTGNTDETKMALPSLRRPRALLRGFKKKRKSKSEAPVDEVIDGSDRTHSTHSLSDQDNHRGSMSSDSTHASSFQLAMDDVLSGDSIDQCVHQSRSDGSVCDHVDSEDEGLDSQSSSDETDLDGCRRASAPPGHARQLRYHRFGDLCRPRSISFLDEERGLTPRHLVTQCNYRPSLTDAERGALFYNGQDFERFEKESLYEEVEEEIRALQLAKERRGSKIDDEKIRSLIRRVESHCNTHYVD